MRISLLLIISVCLSGCNKPNPHPETIDPIYADLQKRSAEAIKSAEEEQKSTLEYEKEMKITKPQTGRIKFIEKRYFESKTRYEKFMQTALYYKMRAESRIKYARAEYLKAWNKKESWPNPNEFKEYLSVADSEFKSKVWNVNERIGKYLEENPNLARGKKKNESVGTGDKKTNEQSSH